MSHVQWFVKLYEIIIFIIQNIMILFYPPDFLLMLYSKELMYNPVHNSKMSPIDKKEFRKKFQVDSIIF